MDLELMPRPFRRQSRRLAKSSPELLDRQTYLWAMQKGAEAIRQAGESEAQAFTRYVNAEDGRELYRAHITT